VHRAAGIEQVQALEHVAFSTMLS